MNSFDLMQEPVFPVVGPHGPETVGVRDTLVRAHELRLTIPDAPTLAAVIRFLLAVVIDAHGQPADAAEWGERWRRGHFDHGAVDEFVSKYGDRFDLFGPRPAWQVADLEAVSGERKPSSLLISAAATGNNVPMFSARTEADPHPLSPAQAALAVLATHAWDTAAIKTGAVGDPAVKGGKTTGNRTGPLGALGVVISTGPTLFHTLMLSMPTAAMIDELGMPWWHREPETAAWSERRASGLLDLLTWQSRRIRLFPEQDPDGNIVVREVLVCAGDRLPATPTRLEIHTAWRAVKNPKAGQPSAMPVRLQPGKALWRGIETLLLLGMAFREGDTEPPAVLRQLGESLGEIVGDDFPLGILAVGVEYGNQSAVVENVMVDTMPMPIAALGLDSEMAIEIRDCARQAEDLRRALNDLGADIRRSTGAESVPWDKGEHPGDQMMASLDAPFRELLERLRSAADFPAIADAVVPWQDQARSIAYRAAVPILAAAPPGGFLGRGEGNKHMTVPKAEMYFRARVRKSLGEPAEKEVVTP